MKNILISVIGLSLLMLGTASYSTGGTDNPKGAPETQTGNAAVQVSSSPELYPLASNWVNRYNRLNPSGQVALEQLSVQANGKTDHLSFVTDQSDQGLIDGSGWKMVIGRDVVVPLFNSANQSFEAINRQGISSRQFAQILGDLAGRTWPSLLPGSQNLPVNIYMHNSVNVTEGLASFLHLAAIEGTNSFATPEEVLAAVQKDPNGIGFCRLSDLKKSSGNPESANVRILPVDKNGNGRLDSFEKIYDNLDDFTHGVWIGKYPAALTRSVYVVSSSKPGDRNEIAFLSWVLTEGQSLLNDNGYCDLAGIEKEAGMAALLAPANDGLTGDNGSPYPKSWPVFLAIVGLAGLFTAIYVYSRRNSKVFLAEEDIHIAPFMVENAMNVPKGLYFDKTHTWAFMEKDGNVKVGMDDFMQHVTGKLTKIKMKEEGETVRKGEKIMTVMHEGKQLSLYAPISGTIIAQNGSLLADSTLMNSSPFTEGWVYRIEPRNWMREVQFMLMGEKYTEWLKDEFARLKEFVTASARIDSAVYSHVVLQDGGELTDPVLADLGPEVWEDFQTNFIDTSR